MLILFNILIIPINAIYIHTIYNHYSNVQYAKLILPFIVEVIYYLRNIERLPKNTKNKNYLYLIEGQVHSASFAKCVLVSPTKALHAGNDVIGFFFSFQNGTKRNKVNINKSI